MIFKPNLPTQIILTDVGTHIDVNELIKYFLNPTPNPRIYRELGDGFIKNYGVTVVIDCSTSCFSPLYNYHTWSTIQILLSSFAAFDLHCFDLIISDHIWKTKSIYYMLGKKYLRYSFRKIKNMAYFI